MSFGIALYDQAGDFVDSSDSISLVSFYQTISAPGVYAVQPTAAIYVEGQYPSLLATLTTSTQLTVTNETGTNQITVTGFA
jgi:hypothetical protein